MLWCCFGSSAVALLSTSLPHAYRLSLFLIVLGYCLHWHFRLCKDPAVSFRILGHGGLACFQKEWRRIESVRYQRWPFCIVLDFRYGDRRKQVLFLTVGMRPNVLRGLVLALAERHGNTKKLPAILTNPVL
jgi:hypothetical protein